MLRLAPLVLILATAAVNAEEAAPAPAAPAPAPAPEAAPAAAGQTFAIVLVSSDGESQNEDLLIFAGDTLSSQGYADSRFAPGKVTITEKDGTRAFEATMASPRGAEAIWSGRITGDRVEGRVRTGVKGRFDVSTFTGTLQK